MAERGTHMRLWKKRATTAESDKRPQDRPQNPPAPADPTLPGSAGYSGSGLGKNAMPETRYTFVRPDGKPNR